MAMLSWCGSPFCRSQSAGCGSCDAPAARRSRVPDIAAWEACRADPAVREAIEADRELAKRIGATGTPTVVINGIRYPEPPDAAALRRIIEAAGGR